MAGSEGTAFGKYFLLKKIATGGMGEIYLAKLKGPVGFEKILVIKRILAHHIENEEFLDMFFAEARVAAQLTHSNVVQIYEMGEIDDSYFIAMEYVHGKSLRDVIDRARELGEYVPPGHVVDIISKLSAGLSYAHNARDMSGEHLNIIHRDINPHNLLVSYSGDVKVIDFGIAKSEMSINKTETGTIKGKFVYMSPEQSAAEKLDKRSDIFAVGICLCETLTFVNPFAKANVVLSLDAIQRKEAPPPSETSQKFAPFDPLVEKALAKKADDRYQDCIELRDELLDLLQSGAVPRSPQSLTDYMHDLFEDQIEQEKRMIIETDSATTGQIEAMRAARRTDSRGQSGRIRSTQTLFDEEDEIAAHAATVDVIDDGSDELRSRMPFFLALAALVVMVFGSLVTIVKMAEPGADRGVAMAMAPVGDEINADQDQSSGGDARRSDATTDLDRGEKRQDRRTGRTRSVRSRRDSRRAEPKKEAPRASSSAKGIRSDQPAAAEPPPPPPPPPKADSPPPKAKARATPPPKPPPPPTFGNMSISTTPPVKITHKGRPGQTFKLRSASGVIIFGNSSESGKFHVKISYKVGAGSITYTNIASDPWAIVRGKGGIGLGKTPLTNVKGTALTLLELLNPKEGLRQRITLRYSPP